MNPPMIAVTIGVGEKWRRLAGLAAESVREQAGLETRILGEEEMRAMEVEEPHYLKFHLFNLLPDATDILFFDADTIFLRPWNPQAWEGRREWIAVGEDMGHPTVMEEGGANIFL